MFLCRITERLVLTSTYKMGGGGEWVGGEELIQFSGT